MDEIIIYTRYEWTCLDCQETNDEGDIKPVGEANCEHCGSVFRVGETR